MKKKIKIKISTPKGNFEVEKFIKDIHEEEHYRNLEEKIAKHERDKEEQLYFYKQFGY
jgi:hypothetical protein